MNLIIMVDTSVQHHHVSARTSSFTRYGYQIMSLLSAAAFISFKLRLLLRNRWLVIWTGLEATCLEELLCHFSSVFGFDNASWLLPCHFMCKVFFFFFFFFFLAKQSTCIAHRFVQKVAQ